MVYHVETLDVQHYYKAWSLRQGIRKSCRFAIRTMRVRVCNRYRRYGSHFSIYKFNIYASHELNAFHNLIPAHLCEAEFFYWSSSSQLHEPHSGYMSILRTAFRKIIQLRAILYCVNFNKSRRLKNRMDLVKIIDSILYLGWLMEKQ